MAATSVKEEQVEAAVSAKTVASDTEAEYAEFLKFQEYMKRQKAAAVEKTTAEGIFRNLC